VGRSLKGEAGRVVMHLGPTASIPEILYKLDSIYGDVEKKVDLLGDFFNGFRVLKKCRTLRISFR
jgi:hypothetical protein